VIQGLDIGYLPSISIVAWPFLCMSNVSQKEGEKEEKERKKRRPFLKPPVGRTKKSESSDGVEQALKLLVDAWITSMKDDVVKTTSPSFASS
jgi:hypothetical protein